jgi:hypothetical protein
MPAASFAAKLPSLKVIRPMCTEGTDGILTAFTGYYKTRSSMKNIRRKKNDIPIGSE